LEVAGIIVLAVVIVIVLLKMRAGPKKKTRTRASKKKRHKISAAGQRKVAKAHDFPAVSIKFGPSACQAVKDLTDKRFLADEAPGIPLKSCNSANCTCKYVHHEIRREHDQDRRAPNSLRATLHGTSGKPERRQGGRRRSSDPR
jgi:hypothetical protein